MKILFRHLIKTTFFLIITTFNIFISKAQSTLNSSPSSISISVLKNTIAETWPTPATVVIRRTNGIKAITIPINITGTASLGKDYLTTVGTSVTIPMGSREVWIQLTPLTDDLVESDETIKIKLQPLIGYVLNKKDSVTVTLLDKSNKLTDEEASRFLIQAGFGADEDELAKVKSLGFSKWIDNQITRPKGYLQPIIKKRKADGKDVFHTATKIALWTQVMRRTPAGQLDTTDILRQRIAYSLLQIFVVSQNVDALSDHSEGVANYYDKLMDGAFGNFRTMLLNVSMHPCMGIYLSHLGNRKPDKEKNTYPDQNYAREIMQLFSIGLWELNLDGTRKLQNGQPIPTYNNADIAEFARVFTGLKWGGPDNGFDFEWVYEGDKAYLNPMRVFENQHDRNAKKLLRGVTLPAGQNTMQDINGAIDNLFKHPNVGPFIGKLLIQRLITSNPSPEYVARVATTFNNNGKGVRGDMGAVVKAILMDPEARNFNKTKEPTYGKMREPYITLMNVAKTFNAQAPNGDYESATYMYEFYLQEPFQSPSVFNFYSPYFRPSGQLTSLNKFAPEFQILTAVTAIETQNNLLNSVEDQIARWGASSDESKMTLKFDAEIPYANNPDALITLLSRKLTGGMLNPKTTQIIREAILGIAQTETNWQLQRVKLATYLVGASSEFNIQK